MSEIFIIKNTGKGVINSLAPENVVPIKSAVSSDGGVITEDSDTVAFTGNGTAGNPLSAESTFDLTTKADLVGGKIPASQLPAYVVAPTRKFSEIIIEAETDGIEIPITGGTYMVYNFRGQTVYRYITTATNANGYPIEDSFYDNLTAGVLSNKITQRNQ